MNVKAINPIVALLLLLPIRIDAAEADTSYLDVYGGMVLTNTSTVYIEDFAPWRTPMKMSKSVEVHNSFALGARYGDWFDNSEYNWLGLAADLSYFQTRAKPNRDVLNVDNYVLAFDVMIRRPSSEGDNSLGGALQPYAGIGAGFCYHKINNLDISPGMTGRVNNDWTFSTALDLRAGLEWKPKGDLATFLEYRFLRAMMEHRVSGGFLCIFDCPTAELSTASINTHHVLVGVRF